MTFVLPKRPTTIETPGGSYRLALPGLQPLAFLIDLIMVIFATVYIIAIVVSRRPVGLELLQLLSGGLFLVSAILVVYYQFMLMIVGATIGQAVLGLRVINTRGAPTDFAVIMQRYIFSNLGVLLEIFCVSVLFSAPREYGGNFIVAGFLLCGLAGVMPFVFIGETAASFFNFAKPGVNSNQSKLILIYQKSPKNTPTVPANYRPAYRWEQFIAVVIDTGLFIGAEVLLWRLFTNIFANVEWAFSDTNGWLSNIGLALLFFACLPFFGYLLLGMPIFNLTMLTAWKGSPGQLLMGLQLIKVSGQPIDSSIIALRYAIAVFVVGGISGISNLAKLDVPTYFIAIVLVLKGLDFIFALINKNRQTLQDLLARTVVVSKR